MRFILPKAMLITIYDNEVSHNPYVEYQGPNQTNLDSIQAWLKHEEPNSTRQQQKVINQTPSPPEHTPTRRRGQRLKFLGSQNCKIILKDFHSHC